MNCKTIINSIFAVAAFAAALPIWADTEIVDGITWTYRINGDTAEICNARCYTCPSDVAMAHLTYQFTICMLQSSCREKMI